MNILFNLIHESTLIDQDFNLAQPTPRTSPCQLLISRISSIAQPYCQYFHLPSLTTKRLLFAQISLLQDFHIYLKFTFLGLFLPSIQYPFYLTRLYTYLEFAPLGFLHFSNIQFPTIYQDIYPYQASNPPWTYLDFTPTQSSLL